MHFSLDKPKHKTILSFGDCSQRAGIPLFTLVKKVEEKISDLELKIGEFESSFTKENPSEETLETYNKIKEELDLTLQEWEFLGTQLES